MGRQSTYTAETVKASIYGLTDPRTGAVRYVGKANDPEKRLKGHLRECRRRKTPVYAWIRKLVGLGLSPGLSVLEADCDDWKEAERRIIAERRDAGEKLLNLADGGDEPHCSIEVRRANAGRLNADPGLVAYREMMRSISEVVRAWEGNPNKAARLVDLNQAIATIRAFTREQKVAAGTSWVARFHRHGAAQ